MQHHYLLFAIRNRYILEESLEKRESYAWKFHAKCIKSCEVKIPHGFEGYERETCYAEIVVAMSESKIEEVDVERQKHRYRAGAFLLGVAGNKFIVKPS